MKTEPIVWLAAGVEISGDRRRTWVALAAGPDSRDKRTVELLEAHPSPHAAERIAALVQAEHLRAVALDPRSQSATLVRPLAQAGVPLRQAETKNVAEAHGLFVDLLNAGQLRVRGAAELDEAMRAAETRKLAGSFAIERYRPDVDQAPVLAAELALWAAETADPAFFSATWR